MQRLVAIFTFTALAAASTILPACTQAHSQAGANPNLPFYVPATLIVQSPARSPANTNAISPLAFQVLAASNDEYAFFPRSQKFVYGDIPLEQYSSYSVLFYDVQPIPSPFGTSYRYAWNVKSGIDIR